MIESISKFFELGARYAGAASITLLILLLVPDDLALQAQWDGMRTTYRGYIWLLFIFTGTIALTPWLLTAARIAGVGMKKLVLPIRDWKSGLKQSRMRYYLVEFPTKEGNSLVLYQEFYSDGRGMSGYFDVHGKRVLPDESLGYSQLDEGKFQLPRWGRIDWGDVFNGDPKSGCIGIGYPS